MRRPSKSRPLRPGRDASGGQRPIPSEPTPSRRVGVAVTVALLVLTFLVFAPTFRFDFVDYDDPATVSQNPHVTAGLTWQGLLWAFTQTQISDWTPLTALSHMVDCQIFGLWAGGHHLVNVLLHGATAVLLFLVLRYLTGSTWRSAFVAALFAIHPLRVESVAWITERKDVLGGLFFTLTIGAYARWVRRVDKDIRWVTLFLVMGLLSKAMLVTTPLVLLLLDRWPLGRTGARRTARLVYEKAPLFALSIAAAVVQLLAARDVLASTATHPMGTRIANALVSAAAYVTQIFWPANLAVFYPYPREGVGALALTSACILLGLLSTAAWRWRRGAPWLAVGWLWYLVMLLPVLGLFQAGDAARADRYTYLPHIGLYIALAWTADHWRLRLPWLRIPAAVLAVLMLTTMAVLAWRQTWYWKDSETLWQHALACTSNNDLAHYNLATRRLQEGRFDEAITHYEQVLKAIPTHADAHINLGRALLQLGRADEAITHYHAAIDLKPGMAEAQYNLAIALSQKGRMEDAITHYRRAIELNPTYFDAHNNLASTLLQAGRSDEAINHYKLALRINPGSAKARNNLATAWAARGRDKDAIQEFDAALRIDPDHIKALNGLAWLLATSGDTSLRHGTRSVELARHAAALTSGRDPLILRTLAASLAESGRFDEAAQTAQHALTLVEASRSSGLARNLEDDLKQYRARQPLR